MRFLLLSSSFLLLAASLLAAEEPARAQEPADTRRIEELIRQLGSEDFEQREKAARDLKAIGPTALELLRKAAQSDDAEIRRAATELVGVIKEQVQAGGLLAPRRLRLDLKEVSVAEAVAELSRRSSYAIALTGDTTGLAQRKVSLQTGDTTFWDALRQLCDKAGLDEVPSPQIPMGGNAPVVRPLLLRNGKATEMSADVTGSVRVRAVNRNLGDKKAGTVTAALELTAEPRLQSFRVAGVPTVTTAVDEHGKALQVVIEPKDSKDNAGETVVVRLQSGERASTRLRELTGRLRVHAITNTEPTVTIEKVLAAAGQDHKGADGTTLHVQSVAKADNGTVRLTVGVGSAHGGMPGGIAIGGRIVIRGGGNIRIGNVTIDGNSPAGVNFPRLFDAKGQEYQLAEVADKSISLGGGLITHNATLVFRPTEAKSEPARLVLYGQKAVSFEVPFTLKNVPVQ